MADPNPRLPLVEPIETRDTTLNFDRRMTNALVIPTQDGPMAAKRTGCILAYTGAVGTGQGMTNYQNDLYFISGDFLNQATAGTGLTAIQATGNASFQPRTIPAAVGFNGALYVMGGLVNPSVAVPTFTSTVVSGVVTGITIVTAGLGYSPVYPTTITLSFSGGGGSGASATATITGQSVSSVHIISGGSSYTSDPTVTVSTNAGWGVMNDVWKSVNGSTWSQVTAAAPWGQRQGAVACVYNNVLYLIGGATGSAMGTDILYSDVWATSDGVNWTQKSTGQFPPRYRHEACVFNNQLWIAGGRGYVLTNGNNWPNTLYSDLWYTSDGVTWTLATANAGWCARANFAFFAVNNTLNVVGGTFPDAFGNATTDAWQSTNGTTWTRTSSNPLGVASSGVSPVAAVTSKGSGLLLPPPLTVGAGAAFAIATLDVDDDTDDTDECDGGVVNQVTFTTTSSGYTTAPTLTPGTTGSAPNIATYAFLDGTSNGGSKALRAGVIGNTAYILDYADTGVYGHSVWSTTNGTTFTNLNVNFTAGWTPRNGEFFIYGNLWFTSGADASNNYYNDVWYISVSSSSQALGPNVPNQFYHFSQTSTGIATPLLVFKSPDDLFSYNAALNVLTKLSNVANYPALTVPGIVYLDGYFFVLDPYGNVWNSSINAPQTWTALGFIGMENEPNGGVAIAKLDNYVVAFGQWTTEFFADAGVSPPASPLLPNTSLPFQVGCAAGESVVELQNTIIWVGQTKREGQSVYTFQNYQPSRVSTPFVDMLIQNDPLQVVRAYTLDYFGHSVYILTLFATQITLVYDFMTQVWSIFTGMSLGNQFAVNSLSCDAFGTVTAVIPTHGFSDGDPGTISGASNVAYNGTFNFTFVDNNTITYQVGSNIGSNAGTAVAQSYNESFFPYVASAQVLDNDYIQDPANGNVYSTGMGTNYTTDAGLPIDMTLYTQRFDGGTSYWKQLRRINLLADYETTNAEVAYTDNDYQSYSHFRVMNLYQGQRATVVQCGRFRRRAFVIRHTASSPFRAMFLELEIIPGDF